MFLSYSHACSETATKQKSQIHMNAEIIYLGQSMGRHLANTDYGHSVLDNGFVLVFSFLLPRSNETDSKEMSCFEALAFTQSLYTHLLKLQNTYISTLTQNDQCPFIFGIWFAKIIWITITKEHSSLVAKSTLR